MKSSFFNRWGTEDAIAELFRDVLRESDDPQFRTAEVFYNDFNSPYVRIDLFRNVAPSTACKPDRSYVLNTTTGIYERVSR